MKVSVDIDCTPEEARRFMGLPDMAPVHDVYLEKIKGMMGGEGISPESFEKLLRTWSPMGEAGMSAWKQLVDQISGIAKK